ncbi:FkbM family methyltransferase [Oxynema sp. CENA135]|uniref:FkbM family methyltransferase n=1 Tax=Oxynema sp. CENA135 TaxID=984206 RepID=UPI00190AED71|nr:FkbM family methyltransferase [Oxynema sp. CENA135]MBK4728703.1 FkbM family methyltransferase [Oxynema sp. CENA135]
MLTHLKRLNTIWLHPSNRGNRLGAVSRSARWWLGPQRSGRTIEVDAFGYKMKLYPDAFQTRGIIYFTPSKDYDITRFIERYLRPGDSFIDIGANIGIYTLLASSLVGKTGSVHAFEPVPQTVNRLQENVNRNGLSQVEIHSIALGETDSVIQFTVDYDATNHVILSNDISMHNCIEVPCKCLDNIVGEKNHTMAKIDVEGWEIPVLRGAYNMLARHNPPVLVLEINGSFCRYGFDSLDVIKYLEKLGYDSALYDADTNQLTFTREVWGDVFFISNEHKNWVLERIN